MAQIINTNISSLTAQRNANRVQGDLATAINRLSSGLRINSAKDDAAGLAISERMTTQVRGMNQAARNANDAISLAQTAEGALGSSASNLQRIRELAVQSANATNSASDRAALQAEAAALIAEVQRVGTQTEFNGIKLLDGSFASQAFQVGANAGQTITVASIADARTTSLGSNTMALSGSVMGVATAAAATVSGGNGVNDSTTLTLSTTAGTTGAIAWAANASAKDIASAINTAASGIGVTATATTNAVLRNLGEAGSLTMDLNGHTIAATINDKNDLTALVAAINGSSSATGVVATFTSSSKSSITLTAANGRNIEVQDFNNNTATTKTVDLVGLDATTGADMGTAVTLTGATNDSSIVTGSVNLSSSKGALTYAAADDADTVFASAGTGSGMGTFSSVATINISSAEGASDALAVIDAALNQINGGRADLGAVQNRFEATIANLETMSENLSASRSRILDADFAKETAAMSRAQVLQQAANAMVAQANQMPQQVLQLLQR